MTSQDRRREYKIVRVTSLRKRSGAAEQERLLNELGAAGWELIEARRSDVWDWESTDSLVLTRTKRDGS